jgi:hypothetical protein
VSAGQDVENVASLRAGPPAFSGSSQQTFSFNNQGGQGEAADDDQAREAALLAQQEEEVRRQTLEAVAQGRQAADDGLGSE